VDDLATAMAILSQPDARDATSLPPTAIDWHARTPSVAGLRIGLMLTPGTDFPVDPEITDTITRAAALFEAHGAIIHPIAPVLTPEILDGIDQFWRARLWNDLQHLPAERRAKILPFIAHWAGQGAHVSGAQAVAGLNRIFDIKRACAALFTTVHAVLSPTTPNLAFPAENASPLNDPARPFGHIGFTLPWNMSEQPALSLNAGFSTSGTPIGLQIITPRFADSLALQLGFWFEHHAGLTPAWPTPPSANP
jgi:Asp-tRNA(Asn)/Glu-tRNA(Gln) amidotransferase A subunit family amidase